jgi:hypothetical protein
MVGINYYLLVKAREPDNLLNSFYVYSFERQRLKKVTVPWTDLIDFNLRYNSHQVVLLYGKDTDRSKTYFDAQEPNMIASYDLYEDTLHQVTDSATTASLQALLKTGQ